MESNKLSAIAMIAVILGVAGLGVGVYSVISVQTGAVKGDDGNDGDDGANGANGITTIIYKTEDVYPCSSETEINNALAAIGTGSGKIIITEMITLNPTIEIDGGGSYIIEGTGLGSLECGGDNADFNITNALSCTIKDLGINASSITTSNTPVINIEENSDNPVYIENVQIFREPITTQGLGVEIYSENVWVYNCYFFWLDYGVMVQSGGNNGYIRYNTMLNCYSYGIYCIGNHIIMENNLINNSVVGIQNDGVDYNIIKGNRIERCFLCGIQNSGDKAIIEGNLIRVCTNLAIANSGATCCVIGNNIIELCREGIYCAPLYNSTITGNTIDGGYIVYSSLSHGIYLGDSEYNVINSNIIYGYIWPAGTSYGIYINSNSNENTVYGNTALGNGDNWEFETGSNTFGNDTTNNFA